MKTENTVLKIETEMHEKAGIIKKQEYLDLPLEKVTNEVWATQQIMTQMNKTQMINALRSCTQIYNAIYKSWARQLPFETIMEGLANALNMTIDDTNKMENKK